ncbi:MAG TPA: FGGY family carbohydrate kinase [Caulobacteraceae bacterium]|nr:FGGY family carbohydrate kinase [Caulobacteraceae bacterium]
MPELILAIDVGTTALGAGVFRPDGTLEAFASQRLVSTAPAPGRVEQDPRRIWKAARTAIADALATARCAADDLAAIGVTSQRTSLMLWDRDNGRPLSPLVVWSDLRGVERAAQLRQAGHFIAPQQAAAKLEAVVAAARGKARRLAWGNVDSWLIYQLSGGAAHVTDASQAWPTGYLDPAKLAWNAGLIEHQGLDVSMFPILVDTWGVLAETDEGVLGARVPICADIADQQAALMAHGGQAGSVKVTYGTSATLDLGTGSEFVLKSPVLPPFVLAAVGGRPRFCLEGMVYSAGSALDWLRGAFNLGDHARFEAIANRASDSGGAWFLPALQGLGAPYGDASRRGVLGGLGLGVTRAHIARAAMEGLAFRVREVFEHVFDLAGLEPPAVLGVDGGLTSNETFLQIQADLLGRPVRRHAIREATACGAAICAGLGAGLLTEADAKAFVRYDAPVRPVLTPGEAGERFAAWKAAVYG